MQRGVTYTTPMLSAVLQLIAKEAPHHWDGSCSGVRHWLLQLQLMQLLLLLLLPASLHWKEIRHALLRAGRIKYGFLQPSSLNQLPRLIEFLTGPVHD